MRRLIDKERLARELAGLSDLSPKEMRDKWFDLFESQAPANLGQPLMTRMIGHRLQEQAFGGLRTMVSRRLDQYANDSSNGKVAPPSRKLKAGTRLIREWQGRSHEVIILDDGVLFRGERYSSLSEVARTITGAAWSGPRFFGLRSPLVKTDG